MKGKLIVIEGIDGSGKATQTILLVRALRRAGFRVATLDYPQYDRFFGKVIGRYLKGDFGPPIDPHLASIIYEADRFETKNTIKQWLAEGKTVVLNRYVTSNQIHQGARVAPHERKAFLVWLKTLEHKIFGLPEPDLVLYLHLPAKIAAMLTRNKGARGYLGNEKMDQMERDMAHQEASAREAMRLAKGSRNWIIINCIKNEQLLSVKEISSLILAAVLPRLKKRT